MRLLCLGAAAVFTGCVGAAPDGPGDDGPGPGPEPTTPTLQSVAAGSFRALSPYTGIDGRAQMVRQLDGKTEISIAATGLTATTMYTAHLHNAPCQYPVSY